MRTWMLVTEHNSHFGDRETVEMPDYLPVTIYADTTGQYSENEIEEMMERDFWGQMIEIPVPENLFKEWFDGTDEEFWKWFNDESTADDTDTIYDWLVAHNYCWKRID